MRVLGVGMYGVGAWFVTSRDGGGAGVDLGWTLVGGGVCEDNACLQCADVRGGGVVCDK